MSLAIVLKWLHILGWAQWMGAQLALAGLARRPELFGEEQGPRLAAALKGLRVTLAVGAVMTIGAALWMLVANPGWFRAGGWVHAKLTLFLVPLVIWLGPLRAALGRLDRGEVRPLGKPWFPVSLVAFILLITLAVLRPF